MGLDNRDYLRDESRRYSGGGGGGGGGGGIAASPAPMCRYLLIVTIAVFLAQIFSTRSPSLEEIQAEKDHAITELQQFEVIGEQLLQQPVVNIIGIAESLALDEFPKAVHVIAGHEEKLQAGLRHIADRRAG